MSHLLEDDLREALADRAALITEDASARLRAVDYRPRSRRLPSRPALGALGLSGAAAATAATILLGSSAAPAFAGWTANPTAPVRGQLAAAVRHCGTSGRAAVLTDTRGPYTASIYADGSTCVQGNGITISSSDASGGHAGIAAGRIELNGTGQSDSDGHALTMVDGPLGAGVTGVSVTRSDGTSIQATVKNGWYLAWWPGTERAVTAQVASTSGKTTQSFPTMRGNASPACPAGAHCSSGYGFASSPGGRARAGAVRSTSGRVSGVVSSTAK